MPLRDPNPTDWPAAQRNFRELAKLVAELRRDIDNNSGSAPTGPAGGVLSGTYPNPGFAVDMATQAELDAGLNGKADASDLSDHESATTNVHGIADTSALAAQNQFNFFTDDQMVWSTGAANLYVQGAGDSFDFSSVRLMSDEATDHTWLITHRAESGKENTLGFYYDGSEVLRLLPSGDVTIPNGELIVPDVPWTPIGSGGSSYASGWSGDSSIGLGGDLAFRVVGGCLHLLGGARGDVSTGLICTLPVTGYEASFCVPDPFFQNWGIDTYALNDDGEITFGPQGPPTTDLIVYFNHVIPLRSP